MNESQAQTLLDFIDANWNSFESQCKELDEDAEHIRSEIEKKAMGD